MSRPTMADLDRPYAGHRDQTDGPSWRRVLLRFFVVVVPGQLIGTAVGGTVLSVSGLLNENPSLANLITVIAGVIAGFGVGLFAAPTLARRRVYVLIHALFAAGSWVLLVALASFRLPVGTPSTPWTSYLIGLAIITVVQTTIGWAVWVLRHRL